MHIGWSYQFTEEYDRDHGRWWLEFGSALTRVGAGHDLLREEPLDLKVLVSAGEYDLVTHKQEDMKVLVLSDDKRHVASTEVAIPTRQFFPGRTLQHATACPVCMESVERVGWSALAHILNGLNMDVVMTG